MNDHVVFVQDLKYVKVPTLLKDMFVKQTF